MNKDRTILRRLAAEYAEAANSSANLERIRLHKAVNDLHMIRPIALISEIPWHEMNFDGSLTLQCEDDFCRCVEKFFRISLYQWRNMPGDMILPPYYRVQKHISSTGIGFSTVRQTEHENKDIQAHVYVDQLENEEDLEKMTYETITYDQKGTEEEFARVAEIFNDVFPIRICGQPTGYGLGCKNWDDIVNIRGLDNLFYDMVDRPEYIHKIISKMTDIFLDKVRQYNELNLFDGAAYYCHSAAALTDDLHPDQSCVKSQDIWGRGLAQILASVSPEMHDEFDTQYMIRAMEPFGLIYYGCCEPLDNKIDVISKIPRLRKISITPWANKDVAAEAINTRYVMSAKPNPAIVSTATLDHDAARAELRVITEAAKRNNCSLEILLKDITTVHGRPQNLFEWEKIAMEAVRNF